MFGFGLPLPIYLAPFLIAWFRTRRGKPVATSLLSIFLMNFVLGWTIVGWFIALLDAFNVNVVAKTALVLAKIFGIQLPAGAGVPMGAPQPYSSSPQAAPCSMCQGSGSMMCSQCGGRGSWYNAPTTATGVAQLATCGACASSGRIRCGYCGGTGHTG
jgi:hypothetical protein